MSAEVHHICRTGICCSRGEKLACRKIRCSRAALKLQNVGRLFFALQRQSNHRSKQQQLMFVPEVIRTKKISRYHDESSRRSWPKVFPFWELLHRRHGTRRGEQSGFHVFDRHYQVTLLPIITALPFHDNTDSWPGHNIINRANEARQPHTWIGGL